jgi:hypothetical protein
MKEMRHTFRSRTTITCTTGHGGTRIAIGNARHLVDHSNKSLTPELTKELLLSPKGVDGSNGCE